MKRTLSILFSILSLSIMAQVPQGVGYQGVATDANGIELVNQSISIRASVLSGSANGTIEWEETHATSTDTFGLFTLTIGQGTNTTNGTQTSFADISWGTNTHFLKIEMDVTGGSTYSNMGTNQMMSVPYALFAESANINYDSISNLLSNDSTFITTVGGGMGGDGCDYKFPEGINGDPIIINIMAGSSYTVPAGKNLYITNSNSSANGGQAFLKIGGFFVTEAGIYSTPMIAKSGDIVEWVSYTGNIPTDISCSGILVNQNPQVQIISIDLMAGNYTVPSSKKMVLYHACRGTSTLGLQGYITINGQEIVQVENMHLPLFLDAGDIVSVTGNTGSYASTFGYLVDENYFANCGGGGSSSTTTINYDSLANIISMDSTFLANVGGGGGSGCDFKFPDGLDGEPITVELCDNNQNTNAYTVPTGKTLYILSAFTSGTISINGNTILFYAQHSGQSAGRMSLSNPIIVGEGQTISGYNNSGGSSSINGFLVESGVTALTITGSYTVPAGKKLYITNSHGGYLYVDNIKIDDGAGGYYTLGQPITVKANQMVNASGGSVANGYLVDENYFAACGGGGGAAVPGPQGPPGPAGPSFFTNMQGGKVDVGSEPGLIKIVAVTFPTPFANPPNVICTASAQPGTIFDDSFNITVRSVTTTGFEMIVNRVDSNSWTQDLDAFWMAFE